MEIDNYFTLAIAKLHRVLVKTIDASLYEHGLKLGQVYVLQALTDNPAITFTLLARKLQADRSTIIRGLQVLCDAGMVKLVTGFTNKGTADLRKKTAHVTEKGKKALAACLSITINFDKIVEKLWVEANMKVIQELLAINGRPELIAPNIQLKRSVPHFLNLLRMTKVCGG